MLKLKPMLERWLHDTDMVNANGGTPININNNNNSISNGQTHNSLINSQLHLHNNCITNLSPGLETNCKRRKKRTSIETQVKVTLERSFACNQKPTYEDISELAEKLKMEKEVVSFSLKLLDD